MQVATRLRRLGRSVDYRLGVQALAKQLKSAAAAGAQRIVILRPDLIQQHLVLIKTLADGREERVPLEEWLAAA
jgi:histidyl-tRNA synthetase